MGYDVNLSTVLLFLLLTGLSRFLRFTALTFRVQGSGFMEYCKQVSDDNGSKNNKKRILNGTID